MNTLIQVTNRDEDSILSTSELHGFITDEYLVLYINCHQVHANFTGAGM